MDPGRTSTEWQRIAARRAFQKDLPGAIEAMRQAIALDPGNFHHWMWLSHLYREAGDAASARDSAREALRQLDEAPDPKISPEEQTRLVVRASLHAGAPERAQQAVRDLESLRRASLERCLSATDFLEWYRADEFAAPTFETLMELWALIADIQPDENGPSGPGKAGDAIGRRYARWLDRGIELAEDEGVSAEDREGLRERRKGIGRNLT